MPPQHQPRLSASATLSLWDGASIVIGIVVGVGIFKAPAIVFSNVAAPGGGMAAWTLGGILALIGALCYAELATTYRRSGGDYVYLSRAYGACVGFLFGWAQLSVILTGSIGTMAYAFADYASAAFQNAPNVGERSAGRWEVWPAIGAVAGLTLVNVFGVALGKAAQNLLTSVKVAGLTAVVAAGLLWGGGGSLAATHAAGAGGFGLAMVFVLYTYGGWNDAAFVAAEIREPKRNIPRVLILGTGSVMAIYLLVNAAYLWGLGFEGIRSSSAPAADVLRLAAGEWASRAVSVVVMISALGAVNGLILTGSRIYATVGCDHRAFAALGRWHPRLNSPVWSLLVQAAFALGLIVAVGTPRGRAAFDQLLVGMGLAGLPWEQYGPGFDTLVSGTAPVFWLFFLLTGLAVFVLRWKDPHVERPFRVPGYPVTPVVFCLTCGYMLYSSLNYAKALSLLGGAPLLLGLPLYWLSRALREPAGVEQVQPESLAEPQ